MGFLGIDIGAVSAKAVILKDNGITHYAIMDTGSNIELIADKIVKRVLEEAEVNFDCQGSSPYNPRGENHH